MNGKEDKFLKWPEFYRKSFEILQESEEFNNFNVFKYPDNIMKDSETQEKQNNNNENIQKK